MLSTNDQFLTQITVCIQYADREETIGTGVLYKDKSLKEKIYVLTAAHCLYTDGDKFGELRPSVNLLFYNPSKRKYCAIRHDVNENLISADVDADYAVIVLSLEKVEAITGTLPIVKAVQERNSGTTFKIKGFPSATQGKEIVSIDPTWLQDVPTVPKFQLHLNQDFSTSQTAEFQVDGFSGSGAFLVDQGQVYLYGVFTRFLEAGKIIICQYLSSINDFLRTNFLPVINFTFFGGYGLTPDFFETFSQKAIINLGPRFNEELNFRLPIALRFNDLAKDAVFKQRFTKAIDEYLSAPDYSTKDHRFLEEFEKEYDEIAIYIRTWFTAIAWLPTTTIDTDALYQKITDFEESAEKKRSELYAERSRILKDDNGKTKSFSYSGPLQGELNRVSQMMRNNSDLLSQISDLHIGLANLPVLLINGAPGSGKSHLFGDIVKGRNENGYPALLLLGQLFRKEKTVWENILSQLELGCTSEQLLQTLDQIGRQTNTRVLLMIDALNEGAGKELWHDAMPGFIHDVKKYPYVGLAMSIRTTYWDIVVTEQIRKDQTITKITHEGFRGNEYKALQLFCKHYDIRQPNFPILAPEYTNPLFLQLICQGLQSSGAKSFPQGFQGITEIFKLYIQAVVQRLEKRNSAYKFYPNLVKSILEAFAHAAFKQKNGRTLTIAEAVTLFDELSPKFPSLLEQFIEEGVIIRSVRGSNDEDVVYFAYERFGDNFITEQLLLPFENKEQIKAAFQKGTELGNLPDDLYWSNDGILEALAILLPEKFGLEIVEVYEWVFEETDRLNNLTDWLNQHMIDSLKWRKIESIDEPKITNWMVESGNFNMDIGNYFHFLIEMTAVANHPFNSDRLFRILKKHKMAERDAFWQRHVQGYHGYNDQEVAYPLTRLIEWSWQDGVSALTDVETARLAGQTLSWVLSTTNRGLRDQATKAMVNLLQDQPAALIKLLDGFNDIDDLYILERLYAVVYGCALRSQGKPYLETLATYVYEKIFNDGSPPKHILLRDYARNTVEYALSCKFQLDINVKLIRPPYRSEWPKQFPTEEEIKQFDPDHIAKDYRDNYGSSAHAIHHSVLGWDFSRYVMDSDLHKISSIRFTLNSEITAFLNELPRGGKSTFNTVKKFFEIYKTSEQNRMRFFKDWAEKARNDFWDGIDNYYVQTELKFRKLLSEPHLHFFEEQILPLWELQLALKNGKSKTINDRRLKLWVVKKVFDLGYDSKIHGSYDSSLRDYDDRSGAKVERIGKKYQWIAYHELLAMLTDNFKVRESYNDRDGGQYYTGPWNFYTRDIDPSFTSRKNREKYDDDDFGIVADKQHWWSAEQYDHWNRVSADWAITTADLPDQQKTIEKVDENGSAWWQMEMSHTWQEPKPLGKSRYDGTKKEIWYMLQSFFVPKSKKAEVIAWLKNQNFFGRWLPENNTVIDLLARENYWSPYSKEREKDYNPWHTLKNSNHKVMLTTDTAIGEVSADKSGAHFYYHMPCKKLYECLNLKYGAEDGEFENEQGQIVYTNESPNGGLMRKDVLEEFLNANNLDIIWALFGEKNVFNKSDYAQDFRKALSGVYYYENGEFTGSMIVNNW